MQIFGELVQGTRIAQRDHCERYVAFGDAQNDPCLISIETAHLMRHQAMSDCLRHQIAYGHTSIVEACILLAGTLVEFGDDEDENRRVLCPDSVALEEG